MTQQAEKAFATLDTELAPGNLGYAPAPANMQQYTKPRWHLGTVLWLVLTSAIAVAAIIMAAWSVREVDRAHDNLSAKTRVVLTSDPKLQGYGAKGYLFAGSGYWSSQPPIKFARSDHAAVPYGSDVILIGGFSNLPGSRNATVLNAVVAYSTFGGTYKDRLAMPSPRARFGSAVLGNTVYIFGGVGSIDWDEEYQFWNTGDNLKTAARYRMDTNNWETVPDMKYARSDLCGGVANGKVYAIGGYNPNDNNQFVSLDIVEEFDPNTNTWREMPKNLQMPTMGDHRCVSMNDKIYMVGGTYFKQPNGVDCELDWMKCYLFSNQLWEYTPATNAWRQLADMTYPRGDFAATGLPGNRILVAGGERSNGMQNQFAMQSVEEYFLDDNIWVEKAPLPVAVFRADMALVDNRTVYLTGGHPSCEVERADGEVGDCYQLGLNSVYSFYDIRHPSIYYAAAGEVAMA